MTSAAGVAATGIARPADAGLRRRSDQGRRHLHRAGRTAMGQPHPQGGRSRRGSAATSTIPITENIANTDYPRVMREYAEAGLQADRRRDLRRRAGGARGRRRLSRRRLPDGLQLPARRGACPNLAVFDNYIQDASYLSGIIAGAMTKRQYRHGRRLPDPRGQPPDARLHGRRARDEPGHQVPGHLHRLVVRSAQGQGNRLRA